MYLVKVHIRSDEFPTYQSYPFNVSAIRETRELAFRKPVVFFVGENGTGKSTLLEAITRQCGIHIWDRPRRHLVHQNPFETMLSKYVSIAWNNGRVPGSLFRAETFHEFADFLDDIALCDPGRLQYHGGKILNMQSHGQGILTYFSGRFQVRGLYLLDEPESALSPASQLKFLDMLRRLGAEGQAQFIIATHSPILLACPDAQIFSFDSPRVQEVQYEETEHYAIYKQFFMDRAASVDGGARG